MSSDKKRSIYNPKSHSPSVYIPCWLIQVCSSKLSFAAKILYGRLSQWCNANGTVHRSVNQLSEEIGMPAKSVERVLKELRDVKLIETFRVHDGGVNHFAFLEHEWMNEPINQNLEYKSTETYTHPPLRNEGTPPSEMRVPPLRNEGPKIKEIKRNNKSFCVSREDQKKDNSKKHEFAERKEKPVMSDVTKQSTSYNPNAIGRQDKASKILEEYMHKNTLHR